MNSRIENRGFLSSIGVERTSVALIAALTVTIFLFLNAIGKDTSQPKKAIPAKQTSGGKIDGLKTY